MDENFIKFFIVSLFLATLATPIVFFVQNKEKNTIYEVKLSDNTIIRDTLYNKNDCFEDKYVDIVSRYACSYNLPNLC